DGVVLGLAGAAAALLGRLGSPRGAVVGGLALGVGQQLVQVAPSLGAAWSEMVPLAVLVAVVAARPGGLRAPRQGAVEGRPSPPTSTCSWPRTASRSRSRTRAWPCSARAPCGRAAR